MLVCNLVLVPLVKLLKGFPSGKFQYVNRRVVVERIDMNFSSEITLLNNNNELWIKHQVLTCKISYRLF